MAIRFYVDIYDNNNFENDKYTTWLAAAEKADGDYVWFQRIKKGDFFEIRPLAKNSSKFLELTSDGSAKCVSAAEVDESDFLIYYSFDKLVELGIFKKKDAPTCIVIDTNKVTKKDAIRMIEEAYEKEK